MKISPLLLPLLRGSLARTDGRRRRKKFARGDGERVIGLGEGRRGDGEDGEGEGALYAVIQSPSTRAHSRSARVFLDKAT